MSTDRVTPGAEVDLRWRVAGDLAGAAGGHRLSATLRRHRRLLDLPRRARLAPDLPVPAGNRIAGTVGRSALAELAWTPGAAEFRLRCAPRAAEPVNDLSTATSRRRLRDESGCGRWLGWISVPASWNCSTGSTTWPTGAWPKRRDRQQEASQPPNRAKFRQVRLGAALAPPPWATPPPYGYRPAQLRAGSSGLTFARRVPAPLRPGNFRLRAPKKSPKQRA
ncbi:MAG: hypothetical protein IPJ42_21765 [Betaproteobacteria bacterium]|nr:hypothetical protein [Betaproteobacteria bacterium]